MATKEFTHLHVHTEYSMLDGAARLGDLFTYAKELGMDHIILNSVANMQKVHHLLDGYAQVYCHLDNDEAGENACVELQKRYGDKVIDHSHLYTGYKDLNEYLMSHKTRK